MGETERHDGQPRHDDGGSPPLPRKVPERIPLWKLEEMMGSRIPAPEPWRAAPVIPEPEPPRRKRRVLRWALIVGSVAAAATLFVAAPRLAGVGDWTGRDGHTGQNGSAPQNTLRAGDDARSVNGGKEALDRPPQGVGEHPEPLGRPAPLKVTSPAFAFSALRPDGKPVTYDPCREIHYVTRSDNQPAAGPQLVQDAVAAASRATGLVFVNDGATTETPTSDLRGYQPQRYGQRWAPVLIAWQTEAEDPRFTNPTEGDVVMGRGGSESASFGDSGMSYVTGQVTLNAPAISRVIQESGTASARALIEHELGHLVGLTHVNDTTQLMNPLVSQGLEGYAAGDLTGLAALGQGKCQPKL